MDRPIRGWRDWKKNTQPLTYMWNDWHRNKGLRWRIIPALGSHGENDSPSLMQMHSLSQTGWKNFWMQPGNILNPPFFPPASFNLRSQISSMEQATSIISADWHGGDSITIQPKVMACRKKKSSAPAQPQRSTTGRISYGWVASTR